VKKGRLIRVGTEGGEEREEGNAGRVGRRGDIRKGDCREREEESRGR